MRAVCDLRDRPLAPVKMAPVKPYLSGDIDDDILPPPHRYPADGEWRFTHEVSLIAVLQVDDIREQALALGWSEADLYQNRSQLAYPYGQEYGLVCFLHHRDIGVITAEAIELLPASSHGTATRFHRPHRQTAPSVTQ